LGRVEDQFLASITQVYINIGLISFEHTNIILVFNFLLKLSKQPSTNLRVQCWFWLVWNIKLILKLIEPWIEANNLQVPTFYYTCIGAKLVFPHAPTRHLVWGWYCLRSYQFGHFLIPKPILIYISRFQFSTRPTFVYTSFYFKLDNYSYYLLVLLQLGMMLDTNVDTKCMPNISY